MGAPDRANEMSWRRWAALKGALWQLLAVALACPVPALATNMTMEVSLGYRDLVPLHRWVPLNVVLENRDRAVSGSLEAVVTSGSEYHGNVRSTTYAKKAELPTNTRKLYGFTILLDTLTHPLVVRLRAQGRVLLSKALNLRNYHTEEPLALVLGGRASFDFLSGLARPTRPVYPREEFLPETWYGYDGAETVILRGAILRRLSQRQVTALRQWIQRGGYCVIPGGVDFSAYLGSRMRGLLPVDIVGLRRVSGLPSLEAFCGQSLIASDPFLVLEASPRDGTVVLREGDIPIIVIKDMGLGRVLFLALDQEMYPFSQWRGRASLWERIFQMRPEQDVPALEGDTQGLVSSMIVRAPARIPSHVSLLAFASIYLILVYHGFYLLRERRWPRRRTLMALAASIGLFSIGGHYLLYERPMGRDPAVNGFARVRLKEQKGIASVHGLVGVYSIRGGDYRFDLEAQDGPVSAAAIETPGRRPLDLELREDHGGREILVSMDRWSHRFFQWEAKIPLPLGGRASMDGGELVVSVQNMTPYPLRDCHVYFANRLFAVGDIEPDSALAGRFGEKTMRGGAELTADGLDRTAKEMVARGRPVSERSMKADILRETLRGLLSPDSPRGDRVLVLGWIDPGALGTRMRGANGYLRPVALVELEMGLSRAEASASRGSASPGGSGHAV